MPIGALIGFLIAENRYFAEVVKPLLFFAFSIPKSIFLPMFILVFGVGFSQNPANRTVDDVVGFDLLDVVGLDRAQRGRERLVVLGNLVVDGERVLAEEPANQSGQDDRKDNDG